MSTLEVNSIQPLSSGSTITLGASGKTLSIPSGCTITNSGTATGFGGGKIGQVVTMSTSTSVTNTSTTHADTGLTANITPSATTSKVMIFAQVACACNRSNAEVYMNMDIVRDSTIIFVQGSEVFGGYTQGTGDLHNHSTQTLAYVDSPSSTSQITYKVTFANQGGGNAIVQYMSTPGIFTLMEILA